MTAVCVLFLLLSGLSSAAKATEIDVNGVAIQAFRGSGSLDDVEVVIQEEAQVMHTLMELEDQLDHALDQASSASRSVVLDVVVGESDDANSGSGFWIDDEIVVVIPAGSRLSEEEKEEIKYEIESEVADTLDAMILDEAVEPPEAEEEADMGGSLAERVERLFEEEAEAEQQLEQMQGDLKAALDDLPQTGGSEEIDIDVTTSDEENEQEVVADEIVVLIPASTGSGPRLTEEEKEEIEQEVGMEAADALGVIIMKDFVGDEAQTDAPQDEERIDALPAAPRLEEDSPLENTPVQRPSRPETPALRGAAATAIAQPGFEHPMFIPHHWQMPPDEQLWTMKLSMLTSISCMTLLLIIGVWTGVRRSRRRAVLDDNHFRWAEAVEYMDAFPYDE